MDQIISRITDALKFLGAFQILAGSGSALAIFLFVSDELLEIVGEEIMMDGRSILIAVLLCMFLVVATGVLSVLKIRWGWIFSFTVATVVLVMALLMGPAALPITKWSFTGLLILSIVNWSAAVVYYFHDLYT